MQEKIVQKNGSKIGKESWSFMIILTVNVVQIILLVSDVSGTMLKAETEKNDCTMLLLCCHIFLAIPEIHA